MKGPPLREFLKKEYDTDQALLAEGGLPADPAAYVKRVNALLV